jgi:glycosyltransferase involved in cell wall biosynthesis
LLAGVEASKTVAIMSNSSLSFSQLEAKRSAIIPPEMAPAPSGPRLKVLVGAYACNPSRGSEDGVGWGWVEAISKYHDLWVLTSDQWRDDIEAVLHKRPELQGRLQFYYVPWKSHAFSHWLWPLVHLYNYQHSWQKAAYELGKRLHEEIGFDIVHQLTYVGFRVPGLLWKLDVPFVWGPIGGLEQTKWALIPSLGLRGGLHFAARNLLNEYDRRFARLPKQAFAAADGGIIAATTGIQREIRRFYDRSSTVVSEIGLPPISQQSTNRQLSTEPLTLLWCGNLLPGKALPFLFSALELLPPGLEWRLTIIGDGPCAANWQRLARKMRLADRCDWLGQVPRQTVLQRMQQAHALVVTSVHDLTSTVVVEALTNGLPVLCPDHCGFTDAVTPECGIRVKASTKHEIVTGLRDAIVKISDETFRFRLAQGAIAQAQKYEWDLKARMVDSIYRMKLLAIGVDHL